MFDSVDERQDKNPTNRHAFTEPALPVFPEPALPELPVVAIALASPRGRKMIPDWAKKLPKGLQESIQAEIQAAEQRGYARAKGEQAVASLSWETVGAAEARAPEAARKTVETETDRRLARLASPEYEPTTPRGRNAEIVGEILKAIAPKGATATHIQRVALRERDVRIASSSMRHALDQLDARGEVVRNGDEWFYKDPTMSGVLNFRSV